MKLETIDKLTVKNMQSATSYIFAYLRNYKPGKKIGLAGNDYIMIYLTNGDIITLQEHDDIFPRGLKYSKIKAVRAWWAGNGGGNEELITDNYYIMNMRWNGEIEREVWKRHFQKNRKR